MNWSINGKTVKSLMKDGKEIVKVERVADGKILYEKEEDCLIAKVVGNKITLGQSTSSTATYWLVSDGDVTIDWGDGTTSTVNNPKSSSSISGLTHTYSDEKTNHDIKFYGNISKLGDNCFKKCTSLTSITIPNSVTSLGYNCFSSCTSLTSVTIPNSVTSFGSACFNSCTGLTSVTIPNSVTNIETTCFNGCTGLTSVTIPNSITSLGIYCFNGCTHLIDYQLYWTDSSILSYVQSKMPVNTGTTFTIPIGETANYIAKGYPSNKLVERST